MKNRTFPTSIIVFFILVMIVIAAVPTMALAADYSAVTLIEEVRTSTAYADNYFKIRTPENEENAIYVEGKASPEIKVFCITLRKSAADVTNGACPIRVFVRPNKEGIFSVRIDTTPGNSEVPAIIDGRGSVLGAEESPSSMPGARAVPTMSEGLYRMNITYAVNDRDADVSEGAKWQAGTLGGNFGYLWKGAVLSVSGDHNDPKLVRFDKVLEQFDTLHQEADGLAEDLAEGFEGSQNRYLDPTLNDLTYVLEDPKTWIRSALTDSQTAYIADVAEEITKGAQSDYEKLLRIFEYVAGNFYYDNYALDVGTRLQYCNPYFNLYALREGASYPNCSEAKVATVCDGYSAMVIALARAEGIPARMVNGIAPGGYNGTWENRTIGERSNHWWTEAYADGRWIVIDADAASLSFWERSSAADKGSWYKSDVLNYGGFDIPRETISAGYLQIEIEEGSPEGKYICYKNEVEQIRALLDTADNKKTNGSRLNAEYDSADYSTWGDGSDAKLLTDGRGRVREIDWSGKKLCGNADFSGFPILSDLSIHSNRLSSLDVSDCGALSAVSAQDNDISVFSAENSPMLRKIDLLGNVLQTASFCHGDSLITLFGDGGTFSFKYNANLAQPLTICAGKAPEGTVYEGIYDSKGNLISADTEYSFIPNGTVYGVYFRDNQQDRISSPAVICDNEPWSGNIRLTWGPVDGADHYVVYRSERMNGKYEVMSTQKSTSYHNTIAELGETYYYKVKAVCAEDETRSSVSSVPIFGTRVLKCPSLYAYSDDISGKIRLEWEAVENADEYEVYRSEFSDGEFSLIMTTEEPIVIDHTAIPGAVYYYKVFSLDHEKPELRSAASNEAWQPCKCAQPLVVSAVDASGKPLLLWQPVKGAERYSVYRAQEGSAITTFYETTDRPNFTDNAAETGKTYYYTVSAEVGNYAGAHSVKRSEKCIDLTSPDAPIAVGENRVSDGKPRIVWEAVEDASEYEIWRANAVGEPFELLYKHAATSLVNQIAVCGETYCYRVRAVDEAGNKSPFSPTVILTADCAQPVVTIGTNASDGFPMLRWEAVEGASSYEVHRSESKNGVYEKLAETPSTEFADSDAQIGLTYYYQVRAISADTANANSAYSVVRTATCACPSPNPTVQLNESSGKPQLTWDKVSGASKYEIWRAKSADGSYSRMMTTENTSYTNKSAEAGVTYYYKVKALCSETSNANSAFSKVLEMTSE